MTSAARFRVLLLCIALSTLVCVSSAQAQYTNMLNGREFSNVYAANADFLMSQAIQNSNFQMRMLSTQQVQREAAAGRSGSMPTHVTEVPRRGWKYELATTDFRARGDRQTVPAEMADTAHLQGRARQEWIDAALTLQQAVEAMPDFRRNNLSYAMTLALGVAIQVRYGGDIGDAAEEALLRSINDALGEAEGWRELSAVELTRAYDTMVITGGLMAGLAEQSDPEMRGMARDMADSTLRAFGLTP
ncbi:MAG: hypothetical protein J0L65_09050 [Xanthomonadales bacterium]|nr:hypothetical protein [Xanthomonadales bacterium]